MMIRRQFWILLLTLGVLFGAGDIIYWRIIAARLRTEYESWVAGRVAEGWQIASGPVSVGGWPRTAQVTVPNLTLHHHGQAIPGDLAVSSTTVMLSVPLINPSSLMISTSGPTHVQVGDAPEIVLTASENWMSMPLARGGAYVMDLHANDLRVAPGTGAWQANVGLLTAEAAITEDANADPSLPPVTFFVGVEAIALPAVVKWPLGTNISSLSLNGQLNGPLPNGGGVTNWAEAWRDGGGSLAITHLAMGWGPLGLTSSATLALDDQLQPMGSGNGRFVGYAATLDRLAAAGMLTKSAATAAKAVLSLLAGSAATDAPSVVDVPLTLQYRTLSMRQVPLLRLPELDWPAR